MSGEKYMLVLYFIKLAMDYILERIFDKNCFTFVDGAGEYPLSPLRTAASSAVLLRLIRKLMEPSGCKVMCAVSVVEVDNIITFFVLFF
jgi:hypothetical protein